MILAIRNLVRSNVAHSLFQQQFKNLNRVTPISCFHHHFHRNEDDTLKRRTGLALRIYSPSSLNNLHKSIQSSSVLNLRCSHKLAEKKKVEDDVNRRKIEKTDTVKHENIEKLQDPNLEALEEVKQLGLFAKFKKMAKDYWYVLIPVHVATSALWLGGFFYASKSGVDIVAMLEYYEFSETIIRPLRESRLGHLAIAYFLYKIATPARYTVTVGGTTFAIRFLSKRGIIKPMPSRDKLVQIYKDKKDEMQLKVDQKKQDFQDKKQEFKQDFKDKKQEFKDKYMKKD